MGLSGGVTWAGVFTDWAQVLRFAYRLRAAYNLGLAVGAVNMFPFKAAFCCNCWRACRINRLRPELHNGLLWISAITAGTARRISRNAAANAARGAETCGKVMGDDGPVFDDMMVVML